MVVFNEVNIWWLCMILSRGRATWRGEKSVSLRISGLDTSSSHPSIIIIAYPALKVARRVGAYPNYLMVRARYNLGQVIVPFPK